MQVRSLSNPSAMYVIKYKCNVTPENWLGRTPVTIYRWAMIDYIECEQLSKCSQNKSRRLTFFVPNKLRREGNASTNTRRAHRSQSHWIIYGAAFIKLAVLFHSTIRRKYHLPLITTRAHVPSCSERVCWSGWSARAHTPDEFIFKCASGRAWAILLHRLLRVRESVSFGQRATCYERKIDMLCRLYTVNVCNWFKTHRASSIHRTRQQRLRGCSSGWATVIIGLVIEGMVPAY